MVGESDGGAHLRKLRTAQITKRDERAGGAESIAYGGDGGSAATELGRHGYGGK